MSVCMCITFSLSIHLLLDIEVVFMSWIFWMWKWTWKYRYLFEIVILFLSDIYLEVGLQDHMVLFLIFWGNIILFSLWLYQFTFPPTVCKCPFFSPSWPTRLSFLVIAIWTDVEAETPILWPPDVKSWLIWKDHDAGKDWRQEEKGMTEDEMVGWHHRLNGHEFG